MTIGQWVRSKRSRKWHVVESVVADEPVTRCGRRLRTRPFEASDVMPLTRMIGQPQLCSDCQ